MDGGLIARQFELNHKATHLNLEGLTHEESLMHPTPGGNCLNWVLGHVVATRNLVMDALGEPRIWTTEEAAPYERGAKPPLAPDRAFRLEEIVAAFDRSQTAVVSRLSALGDEDLQKPVAGDTTLGERLAVLSFHEAYHAGQSGLLRRLLGRAGAIG